MIRLVVFDLDGTLFRGDEVLHEAVAAVRSLRASGVEVRFLTNNSGATRDQLTEKLSRMGFGALLHEVSGTSMFAAKACQEAGFKRPLLIGEPGMHATFHSVGFDSSAEEPDVVIAGICRTFTYQICNEALQAIRAGAAFWCTNRDATYPIEGGRVEPGAGSIVAAIEACSGVTPRLLGKPEPDMILHLLAEAGVAPNETLVVGDRMETDIEAGRRAGCHTILVLTGATETAPENVTSLPDLSLLDLANWAE